MTKPILLVEDTPSLSMVYEMVLRKAGHETECVTTIAEAREKFSKSRNQIVLLDLILPDGDGTELMSEFISQEPNIKIIVITANGSINRAVEAMRLGSFDFLVKPFDEVRLLSAVGNAIKTLEHDTPSIDFSADSGEGFQGFIGSSEKMRNIYDMIRNIGRSTATVFVTGGSAFFIGNCTCERPLKVTKHF